MANNNIAIPSELPGYYQGILGSSALWNLSFTSLKHTVSPKNSLSEAVTSRVSYGEATVHSLVSAVYNCAIAALCTAALLFTFGLNTKINNAFQKYWIYTALAAASLAIATIGIISPEAARIANLSLLTFCGTVVIHQFERDLLPIAQQFFNQYANQIAGHNGDDLRRRVNGASSFEQLAQLASEAFTRAAQAH